MNLFEHHPLPDGVTVAVLTTQNVSNPILFHNTIVRNLHNRKDRSAYLFSSTNTAPAALLFLEHKVPATELWPTMHLDAVRQALDILKQTPETSDAEQYSITQLLVADVDSIISRPVDINPPEETTMSLDQIRFNVLQQEHPEATMQNTLFMHFGNTVVEDGGFARLHVAANVHASGIFAAIHPTIEHVIIRSNKDPMAPGGIMDKLAAHLQQFPRKIMIHC